MGATPTPMPTSKNKKTGRYWSRFIFAVIRTFGPPMDARWTSLLVPSARLELAQLSPLPPQDSVSTNFTTTALFNSLQPWPGVRVPPAEQLGILIVNPDRFLS